MKADKTKGVARRELLGVLGLGAGAAVAGSGSLVQTAAAASESQDERRKARYQADSPDVQAYYRVNRYPAK